jgi:signal transduction histidine kinase
VTLNLDVDGLNSLPKTYELPLFRVIQELCSNVKRHAQAEHVTLTVIYNPDESPLLRGYVTDNGRGFVPKESVGRGLGLTGVRERIEQVGGRLTIESTPGQGSQFQFIIPVERHVPASLSA